MSKLFTALASLAVLSAGSAFAAPAQPAAPAGITKPAAAIAAKPVPKHTAPQPKLAGAKRAYHRTPKK